MSIQAVSNSNVSFGHIKTTKNGNEYKKTHTATRLGAAAGAGYGAYGLYKFTRALKTPGFARFFKESLVQIRQGFMTSGLSKAAATKLIKFSVRAGAGAVIAGCTLAGLALGAIVNKVINHHRANKTDKLADKAVQAAEAQKS